MRLLKAVTGLFMLTLFSGCGDSISFNTSLDSYKALSKHFKEVPDGFKTVPFWVWNGEITKEMINEQLSDYASKGFGGVFVHPRYGLITEYASEDWYDMVEYALKRARRLGLDLWLYDENSFPSGFAGGHVPAEMPASYNQGHALKLVRQNRLEPDSAAQYLMIFQETDSLLDITTQYTELVGNPGSFLLYEKVFYPVRDWYAGFSYVDLLYPGVTEKFIEVTMTGYEERFEGAFGRSVPGVFTDEPNIAPQGGSSLIRWTPDLFDRFRDRWGYSLEPHLYKLVEEAEDAARIRHNYQQLLLDLFIDRWSDPWFSYTEEHGLAWTGHYWEHGWPSPHHGPDHMAMYAWHQVPGIDMLFNSWDERPDQFGNIRAVRELNSVANQLGRVRKLSETYGAAGWELTFEDMKRNGDWQAVLGVNLMNQHLSYQTLMGDRKHDFPQSFSYHAPYWEEYPVLNEYYSRLSFALSCGKQVNRTLVLEPTTSAWMHYVPGGEDDYLQSIDDEFGTLLAILENEQIEYDLGSENIIKYHGLINDDVFRVGDRAYSFVVIPKYLTNLNSETADLLDKYLENGGIIVALCQPPAYQDGMPTDRFVNWSLDFSDQWLSLAGCNDPRLISYLRTDEFVVVEREGGDLFHMRRELKDGQLLFLVNSSLDEVCNVRMISQGADMVHMDLNTGALENYPCVYSNDILSYDANLPPCGSILLFISNQEVKGKATRTRRWTGRSSELELSPIAVKALSENVMTLDYCRVIMNGDTTALDYFYPQQTKIFQQHGFERNPWVSASQYKTEIIDRDTFSSGSGFTAEFPFHTDSRFESPDLRLVVERPHLYKVYLNGEEIEPLEDEWWLDKSFGVFRIRGNLLPGDNVITLTADPMSVFCELEPVYLVGDFDLLALDSGWLLSTSNNRKIGSWKSQGMPFYSDRVAYSTSFNLDNTGSVRVVMPSWEGTVAKVIVNEKEAGLVFLHPDELRIDDYVKRGTNEITVEVVGSLKNLLGPHHNVTRKGIVTPWSFKYAPVDQPSGMDYDLLDYGLLEPFRVEVMQ